MRVSDAMVTPQPVMKECPTCGVVTDGHWFCRNCGEFFRAPGTDRLAAGPWRRFSAWLIDLVLFLLLVIVGWFIWFGFFTARQGQTPGKQILGLRVMRLDGTVATPGTMWLREVVIKGILWNITEPLSYAAYIWAFFDRDRQAIHDKMVDTYVIYHRGPAESLTAVPLTPGEQYAPPAAPSAPVEDVDAALRRLAKMRDDKLITDEEYEEKRKALVKRL